MSAVRSLLHPLLLQPHGNQTLNRLEAQLESADRAQRDELVRGIARRTVALELQMASSRTPRPTRRTRCELRALAFPVWFQGRCCLVAVTEHFIEHPRHHLAVTHWYPDLASARAAHPEAHELPDVPAVAPRLERLDN